MNILLICVLISPVFALTPKQSDALQDCLDEKHDLELTVVKQDKLIHNLNSYIRNQSLLIDEINKKYDLLQFQLDNPSILTREIMLWLIVLAFVLYHVTIPATRAILSVLGGIYRLNCYVVSRPYHFLSRFRDNIGRHEYIEMDEVEQPRLECMVKGSELENKKEEDYPKFQFKLYGSYREDPSRKFFVGYGFRMSNYLVTAGHNVREYDFYLLANCRDQSKYIQIKSNDFTTLKIDVAVIKLTDQVISKLNLSKPKMFNSTLEVGHVVHTYANNYATAGLLKNANETMGLLKYSGSTLQGFSGAPYVINNSVLGLHTSGTTAHGYGYEAEFIKVLCDLVFSKARLEDSFDWIEKQMEAEFEKTGAKVPFTYTQSGGEIVFKYRGKFYPKYVDEMQAEDWRYLEEDSFNRRVSNLETFHRRSDKFQDRLLHPKLVKQPVLEMYMDDNIDHIQSKPVEQKTDFQQQTTQTDQDFRPQASQRKFVTIQPIETRNFSTQTKKEKCTCAVVVADGKQKKGETVQNQNQSPLTKPIQKDCLEEILKIMAGLQSTLVQQGEVLTNMSKSFCNQEKKDMKVGQQSANKQQSKSISSKN